MRSLLIPPLIGRGRASPYHTCLFNRVPGADGFPAALPQSINTRLLSSMFGIALNRRLRILFGVETACSLCGAVLDCWSDDAFACCCSGVRVVRLTCLGVPAPRPTASLLVGLCCRKVLSGQDGGPAIGSPGARVCVMFLGGWVE